MNVNELVLDTTDERALVKALIVTALLWIGAFILRGLVAQYLRSKGLAPTELRRLMASTRNGILFVLVVATTTVWFDELRTFAVSLVAVAAAIVIATKELLMGMGGTFLRTSARIFDIGDRIEVAGLRGDVVDTSLFTTTIVEIGPGRIGHSQTGRSITLPNAMFLTSPIVNESFASPFVIHSMEVPIARDAFADAEARLRAVCDLESAPFIDDARKHFDERLRDRGLEAPQLQARVMLRLDDAVKATLIATFVCPARRRGLVEQAVLRRFLDTPTAATPATATTAAPTAASTAG